MSLTSFVAEKKVREWLRANFIKPKPCLEVPILAEPQTTNYSWVGTAFDYLLRFNLETFNKNTISKGYLVANLSQDMLKRHCKTKKEAKKIYDIIQKSINYCEEYGKTGKGLIKAIESTIVLAKADVLYRAGILEKSIGEHDKKDVKDLKKLLKIVNSENFTAKKHCILNPTFGKGSMLVGGADVDLVIDDIMIDIKTTKHLKFTERMFHQLIGYYFLYLIGGIDKAPKRFKINYLAVYFSRHGLLFKIPVRDVIDSKKIKKQTVWFKQKAEEDKVLNGGQTFLR